MSLSLEFGIPDIFEVLAVYNIQDAIDRSTQIKENRGAEAGNAAMSMIETLSKI
jgi:6,7-dimethyl-8-ribityllumazine synthase